MKLRFLVALSALLLLSGCAGETADDVGIPAQITAIWAEEPSSGWESTPEEVGECAAFVRFTTDTAVESVTLSALTAEVREDGGLAYTLGETLYAAPALSPETPLTAALCFVGVLPEYGLCYRELDGTEHCLALFVSGEDGSLLWEEISLS